MMELIPNISMDTALSWEVVSRISNARCKCLTALFPGNKLLVVGSSGDNEIQFEVAAIASTKHH